MYNLAFIVLTLLSLCYVNANVEFDLDSAPTLFLQYIQDFDKKYESHEELLNRFNWFKINLKKINELNKQNPTHGLTSFTDNSEEEIAQRVSCVFANLTDLEKVDFKVTVQADSELDWRSKGVVTEVKNQLLCGSCWAFSTTGEVEGQNARKTGKLISLSEQELVDCAKSCHGCGGGYPHNAMNDIAKLGGLMTEESYKYEAKKTKCRLHLNETVVKINGGKIPKVDENNLDAVLTQHGPISAGVNAHDWHSYSGGVFNPPHYSKIGINHAVLVVGYTSDYWIIKNSWGTQWGEQGYMRLKRGHNLCGFGTYFAVSY